MTCDDYDFLDFAGKRQKFDDFCNLKNISGEKAKKCAKCGCGSTYSSVRNDHEDSITIQSYCRCNFIDRYGKGCSHYEEQCKLGGLGFFCLHYHWG